MGVTGVEVAVACGCALGEGPVWDHRVGTLYWVDILGPALWRLDAAGAVKRLDVAEKIGFVALTPSVHVVLAGLKSGLALIDVRNGNVQPVIAPEADIPGNRINDGTVGPDGVTYFGTMDDGENEPNGAFWRFDGRSPRRFGPRAVVTNGPALSPDGALVYFADTKARVVFVCERQALDLEHDAVFVRFPEAWGYPDGITVDAEGHVWVCHWGAARVTRFSPQGEQERAIEVPATNVTKCVFGGAGFDTLYVTTASVGRDRADDPLAGHVFSMKPGVVGQPSAIARIALPPHGGS